MERSEVSREPREVLKAYRGIIAEGPVAFHWEIVPRDAIGRDISEGPIGAEESADGVR